MAGEPVKMTVIVQCRDANDLERAIEDYKEAPNCSIVYVDHINKELHLSAGIGDFARDAELNYVKRGN